MIPVDDSYHLLNFEQVDHLIELTASRVVVPMHYLVPGITAAESTLKGLTFG